jgi:type IV pilus assembly protein PilE
MNLHKKDAGFTLIELMIIVAIVAILVSISYASYMDSVHKSGRADAKVALNDVAQRLQRCFTTNNAYNSGSCSVVADLQDGGITSSEGFYTVTVANLTATTYTLTAAPVAGKRQSTDGRCTSFTITHTGARSAAGSDSARCW